MRASLVRLLSFSLVCGAVVGARAFDPGVAHAATAPSFTVTKTTFAPDEKIAVTFSAALSAPAGQSYWITLIKATEPDSAWGAWHYVKAGASSDVLQAGAPGEYEIRLHDLYPRNSFGVLARQKVTIKGSITACAARWKDVPGKDKLASLSCSCAANPSGSVWGTDLYTDDSSICNAALHAGAIAKTGGNVTLAPAAGCSSYLGTTRNGVASSQWGAFGGSFYFPGYGSGTCGAGASCPANAKSVSGTLTCNCAKGVTGSVWGSDIYTTDSSVCRAAQHAGVIGDDGGLVTLRSAGGCAKYTASNANGVSSSAWGSYESSFFFPAKNRGVCAK